MGTSKSYGGPHDRNPLLPSWAQGIDSTPAGDSDTPIGGGITPDGNSDSVANKVEAPSQQDDPVHSSPRDFWRVAKSAMGKATRSGGDRQAYASAGRSYVRAHGGASKAASSAKSGQRTTAALASFLSSVASRGPTETIQSLGLTSVVGTDAKIVFAAISNLLAPDGASAEEVVARTAVDEVLETLYSKYEIDANGLAALSAMSADDVRSGIIDSVYLYVYHRWLEELGLQIEMKAISPAQAVKMERDVKTYVKDAIILDLANKDPLKIDWAGAEGKKIISDLYTEAYGLIGGKS